MDMINFLSRNAWKVYNLFDHGYHTLEEYWNRLANLVRGFFYFTLPILINPLINVGGQLIHIVYNMMSRLTTLSFTLYHSLENYVFNLSGKVSALTIVFYNQLTDLGGGLYGAITTIARVYFGSILTVVTQMMFQLSYTFFSQFARLRTYLEMMFGVLFTFVTGIFSILVNFINMGAIGFISSMISIAPSLFRLISIPFNTLNFVVGVGGAILQTITNFGQQKLWYLMGNGFGLLTNLEPLQNTLFTLLNPTNFSGLMAMLVSYKNGLPDIKQSIINSIETKLIDTILDIIEKALERYF